MKGMFPMTACSDIIRNARHENYVDSVRLLAPEPPSDDDLATLDGFQSQGLLGGYYPEPIAGPPMRRFRCELKLHRPSPFVLHWAERRAYEKGWHLVGADFPHDVIPDSPDDVDLLLDWILTHMVVRYRRAGTTVEICEGTYYFGPRLGPRTVAVYAHKPSKVTGEPCVHIEPRPRGRRALQSLGIYCPSAILGLDLMATVQRFIYFADWDLEALGRIARWRTGAAHTRDAASRLLDRAEGERIATSTMSERGESKLTATTIRAACATHRIPAPRVLTDIGFPWLPHNSRKVGAAAA